jgi:hypothetical protein
VRWKIAAKDGVAALLADALHGCEVGQHSWHVERASMIYESLAKMHTILWRTVDLASSGKDYQVGD